MSLAPVKTKIHQGSRWSTHQIFYPFSINSFFLHPLRVSLCFPNAGRIASWLTKHESIGATEYWLFSRDPYNPTHLGSTMPPHTLNNQAFWLLLMWANWTYFCAPKFQPKPRVVRYLILSKCQSSFGSDFVGKKVTLDQNWPNETIQPNGWACWSGRHQKKHGDEIYFGHVRWLWILRMRTIVMPQLKFWLEPFPWFTTILERFNVACALFVAPTFGRTHEGVFPTPSSKNISTFASGLSGSKDGDMSTSTSWSFLPSQEACVGAESNKWW